MQAIVPIVLQIVSGRFEAEAKIKKNVKTSNAEDVAKILSLGNFVEDKRLINSEEIFSIKHFLHQSIIQNLLQNY